MGQQKYALLSVSDKTGIEALGQALSDAGYTILSTGGTAKALLAADVPVTKVSDHTGSPEIMNGRVKTLHPRIHGGILGDRDAHRAEAEAMDIPWIDLVAVNLYPFEAVTSRGATLAEAVETIDIGGPTMVRAAAKNHKHVTVVVDPNDYPGVVEAVQGGTVNATLRQSLAVKAFQHTARYDSVISDWLSREVEGEPFPAEAAIGLKKVQALRYGENPHQSAAFYADVQVTGRSLARAVQHQGKQLSFNNLGDLDGALRAVFEYSRPACAIIKHMNAAGAATAETLPDAFRNALKGDPVSAFGGIVVFNRPVDGETVRTVRQSRTFFEVLAAPGFTPDALERLAPRAKMRVLELPKDWAESAPPGRDCRRVQGGWLVQDWDLGADYAWTVASDRAPTAEEERALRFAWKAARNTKSNAIVLARANPDGESLNGVGAGQMSRVDSVRVAISKATAELPGSVLASDAFFPFPDGIQVALDAGVMAFIQPGGSVKDDVVLKTVNDAGATMVYTGFRHFRH
jgi:phosphoribosylaminoimidazolecarboxamide formyltransferase / IMP cyclohydrolase